MLRSENPHPDEKFEEHPLTTFEEAVLWETLLGYSDDLRNFVEYLRERPQTHDATSAALESGQDISIQEAFTRIAQDYNAFGRLSPEHIRSEVDLREHIMQTDFWHNMLLNRRIFLARGGKEDKAAILDILMEGGDLPEFLQLRSLEEEKLITKRPQRRSTFHYALKKGFKTALAGAIGLQLVQDHQKVYEVPPVQKIAQAAAISQQILRAEPTTSPLLTATAQKTGATQAVPSLTKLPEKAVLPAALKEHIQHSPERKVLQEKSLEIALTKDIPQESPSPAVLEKHTNTPATPTAQPDTNKATEENATPSPTPSASAENSSSEGFFQNIKASIAKKVFHTFAGSFMPATMGRIPEGAEKIIVAQIYPPAPFTALATNGQNGNWQPFNVPKSPNITHSVTQDDARNNMLLLHAPHTAPLASSFVDEKGQTVPVSVESDGKGNFRARFTTGNIPKKVTYRLFAQEEREKKYTPTPNKQYEWTEQTTQLLAQVKNLPPEQQAEALRMYIKENGKYSTSPEHFAKFARTMELRDQFMIMDCDVAAELLQAYLNELGIQNTIQAGFLDNGDGVLTLNKTHGIVRAVLPNGTVRYYDATPTEYANEEEEKIMARQDATINNTLKQEQEVQNEQTPFEQRLQALYTTVMPLDDATRIATYRSILQDIDEQNGFVPDDLAYLYDYVFKELLIHGDTPGSYPQKIWQKINRPEATQDTALDDATFTRALPAESTLYMQRPQRGALHLRPHKLPFSPLSFKHSNNAFNILPETVLKHPALKDRTILRTTNYVVLKDGSIIATLVLQEEDNKEVDVVLMKDRLIYLGAIPLNEIRAASRYSIGQSPIPYTFATFYDAYNEPHVLVELYETDTDKRIYYLDGEPFFKMKGAKVNNITLLPGKKTLEGAADFVTASGERQKAMILGSGIENMVTSINGHPITEVSLQQEKGAMTFSYTKEGDFYGFVDEGKPVTEYQKQRFVHVSVTEDGHTFWITEDNQWGFYDKGSFQHGGRLTKTPLKHAGISSNGTINLSDNRIAVLNGKNLLEYVSVHGRKVAILEQVSVHGKKVAAQDSIQPFEPSSDKLRVLTLADGRVVTLQGNEIVLMESPAGFSLQDTDWGYSNANGIQYGVTVDRARNANIIIRAQNGKWMTFHPESIEGVEKAVTLETDVETASFLLYMTNKRTSIISLNTKTQKLTLVHLPEHVQYKLERNLANHGGDLSNAYIIHDDNTASINTLYDQDGSELKNHILFHGHHLKPGMSVQQVHKTLFPKQNISLKSSEPLKIKHMAMINLTTKYGGKVIFYGSLENPTAEAAYFFLTSDGMSFFQSPYSEPQSGNNNMLTYFTENGEIRYIPVTRLFNEFGRVERPVSISIPTNTVRQLTETPMGTVYSVKSSKNGLVLTGTTTPATGVEHQSVIYVKEHEEIVIDRIHYQSTTDSVTEEGVHGLHDIETSFDKDQQLVVKSTGYSKNTGKSSRFIYENGRWKKRILREETNPAKELLAMLPGTSLLQFEEAFTNPVYREKTRAAIKKLVQTPEAVLSPKNAKKVTQHLTIQDAEFIRSLLSDPQAREFFIWHFLTDLERQHIEARKQWTDLLQELSDKEILERFQQAIVRQSTQKPSW